MRVITLGTSHGDPTATRFSTSTLAVAGDVPYLIDAGAPVTALLRRQGTDANAVRAVFVTHMHEDHYAGLSGLIKHRAKHTPDGPPLDIWLPEEEAEIPVRAFVSAAHRPIPESCVRFRVARPGVFHRDTHLTATAIPTRHFENEGLDFPSYAYLLETPDARVLFTGDLKGDFSDFPFDACAAGTSCFCELTHYPLEIALPRLAGLPLKRIVFHHIGDAWNGARAEARFHALVAALPYPAHLAGDGDEYICARRDSGQASVANPGDVSRGQRHVLSAHVSPAFWHIPSASVNESDSGAVEGKR